MNKGQKVKFSELQIGDLFSDNARQKYRKIPEYLLDIPALNLPVTMMNTYHIQSSNDVFLDPDEDCFFIANSTWDTKDHSAKFKYSDEISELEHNIEFFTNYIELLKTSMKGIETSDSIWDTDEFYSSIEVDRFSNLLRTSFFVSLYSYLENQVNNECQRSKQENPQIKISLSDIRGRGIIRAKIYLVKVLDTSFPFGKDPTWESIQWLNEVRNCIVHSEGRVSDKLKKHDVDHPFLHYEMFFGNEVLVLDEGFCENAISVINSFLQSMLYHRQADRIQ
jgi:hypothetical protein